MFFYILVESLLSTARRLAMDIYMVPRDQISTINVCILTLTTSNNIVDSILGIFFYEDAYMPSVVQEELNQYNEDFRHLTTFWKK